MVAPNRVFRLGALFDSDAMAMFSEIVAPHPGTDYSVQVAGRVLGHIRTAKDLQIPRKVDWSSSRTLTALAANVEGCNVSFRRSISEPGPNNTLVDTPSAWETEVWIEPRQNEAVDHLEVHRIASIVDRFRLNAAAKGSSAPTGKDVLDAYAYQLRALTDFHNKLLKDTEAERRARSKEYDELQLKLSAEHQARRADLDAEGQRERDALAAEKQALALQRKALDDRSHMHARREMRESITHTLRERLKAAGVGKTVATQRMILLVLCLGIMSVFGAVATQSTFEATTLVSQGAAGSLPFYVVTARSALALAGALGLAFYLLNWQRQVHDSDLATERDLERYLYDVDRASWVIETVLEAQSKELNGEQGEVPAEWIEGVTHGLFQRTGQAVEANPIGDAVASLLDVAAEAELSPSGSKIRITKRGLRQLKKKGLVHADE